MKRLFVLPVLLTTVFYFSARAQNLYGYVLEQNSGKKPVPGVKLKSTFGANQVTTTKKGDYTLTFQDGRPGKSVILVVEKDDWVITDKGKLEANLPEDAFHHPHTIILCRRDIWEKQNKDFKTLLENYIRKSYDREKEALNKQDKQYQAIIDSLQAKYTNLEKNLGELAEIYSKTNLDEISETEQKAYALFKEGRIDECIALRKSLDSENNLKKTKSKERQLDSLDKQLDKVRASNKKEMEMHIRNLKEEVRLAKLKYDFATAEEKLHFLAINDTADTNNFFDYANFLFSIRKDNEAIYWYNKILTTTAEDIYPGVKNQLGLVYWSKGNYKLAEQMYRKALQVYRNHAQTDPGFRSYISTVLINLGNLELEKNNFSAAEADLLESLDIERKIIKENQGNASALGSGLINLGNLYMAKGEYRLFEKTLLEALEIYKQLYASDENTYKENMASVLMNLGSGYYKTNNPVAAEKYFMEALPMKRELAKNNPAKYGATLADLLMNLGILYTDQNKYDLSEKFSRESYEILKQLVADNPGKYESNLAASQSNMGLVYASKKDYQLSETYYLQSLELKRQLAKDNPDVYENEVASTLSNLGKMYEVREKYDSAWKAYNESLEIRRRLVKISPEAYETDLANILTNMGSLYYKQRNFPATKMAFFEVIEIRERWAKKNPAAFQQELASMFFNLGLLYQAEDDCNGSVQMFQKAANSFEYCMSINPVKYETEYYKSVLYMADIYLECLPDDNLEEYKLYSRKADSVFQKYPANNLYKNAKSKIDSALNDPDARAMYRLYLKKSQLKGKEKIQLEQQLVGLVEKLAIKQPDMYALTLAKDLNNFAWDLLLDKQFAKAEAMTRKALTPALTTLPTDYAAKTEWINCNLALALLFQNKYEEAEKIYLLLKDKPNAGATYKKTFLADLDEMEKAGISNKNVKKVRELLNK